MDLHIHPQEIVNDLFPNVWVLLAHIFASIVLILVLTKWLYHPVKRNLKKRQVYIQTTIDNARQRELVAIAHENKAKQQLLAVNNQRNLIFEQVTLVAEKQKNHIVQSAVREAKLIRSKANTMIVNQRRSMEASIRNQIIDVAFAASQAVIGQQINAKQHQKLVEKFIDEL